MSSESVRSSSGYSSAIWSSGQICSEETPTGALNRQTASAFFDDGDPSPAALHLVDAYQSSARSQLPRPSQSLSDGVPPADGKAPSDSPRDAPDSAETSPLRTVADWINEHPRILGGLRALGGAAETTAGGAAILAPEPTTLSKIVGIAAVSHGIDSLQAGLNQMWTGHLTPTLTSSGLQQVAEATGLDSEHAAFGAELADAALGAGLSLGAGALASTANAMKVAQGQQVAAAAAKDGSSLGSLRAWWLQGAQGDAAWRASSTSEKFFYELGQKTLTDANWQRFGTIADPIERGRAIWAAQGVTALLSEGHGFVFGAGKTLTTGPTPGARMLAQEGAAVAGSGGSIGRALESGSREVNNP